MANAFSKGLGGAASGYAVGGPIGAGIGGLIGLLGGSDDTPQLGDYQFSPGSLKSYNFSDVNLRTMNPELYQKLMQNDQVLHDLQGALAARREGPTANENRQQEEYLNRQASGMAGNGMAGTPMGNAQMADTAARLMDSQRDRAFQEYQQLQGQVAGQANANTGLWQNAQGQAIGQLNNNRQTSLAMDQLNNERQIAQYGQAQQAAQAGNQFWGGLLNGGLGYLGNQQNMQGLAAAMGGSYTPHSVVPVGDWLNQGASWLGDQFGGPAAPAQSFGGYSAPSAPSAGMGYGYGGGVPRVGFIDPRQLGGGFNPYGGR